MKKFLLVMAVVASAASFTSCKKCVECTHSVYGDTDEFCGGDAIQRDVYKSSMESSGYTCSKK